MKTADEIRQHIRDLITLQAAPCRCLGTEHAAGCVIGGHMMQAAADALACAIGENERYQTAVDHMRRGASDYISSG